MPCSNTKSHPAWDKLANTGPQGPQGIKGSNGASVDLSGCLKSSGQLQNTIQLNDKEPLGTIQLPAAGVTLPYLIKELRKMGLVSQKEKTWFKVADIEGEAVGVQPLESVSLSADGKMVAVGSPGSSTFKGHVGVFSYTDNGEWEPMGDNIVGVAAGDRAGYSVSLSADGKTVAVGSPGSLDSKGQVRVYSYDDTTEGWVPMAEIEDAVGVQPLESVSLSADGRTVAVGAPGSSKFKGQVRVFSYDGRRWAPIGKNDDIEGEAADDGAGVSVSLSADGRTVAVGAPGPLTASSTTGHVRVFSYDGTHWVPVGGNIEGEAISDQAGESVSLSADGSTVAVGAPGPTTASSTTGNVRVFSYNGIRWTQIGSEIEGEAAEDRAGFSVSLSADGKTVAVGAPVRSANQAQGSSDKKGKVRVFSYNGTQWTPFGSNIVGVAAGDRAGFSVSLSADGKTVAVGSPGSSASKGQVRVFEL